MEAIKPKSSQRDHSPIEIKLSSSVGGGCYSQNNPQIRSRTIKQNNLNIRGKNFECCREVEVALPQKIQIKITKKKKGGKRQIVRVPQLVNPTPHILDEKQPSTQLTSENNIIIKTEKKVRPSSCLGGPSMHLTDSLINDYIGRGKLKLKPQVQNSVVPIQMVDILLPKKRKSHNICKQIRTLFSTLQNSRLDLSSTTSKENLAPHYFTQDRNNLNKKSNSQRQLRNYKKRQSNKSRMSSSKTKSSNTTPATMVNNMTLKNFNYDKMQQQVEECNEKFHVLYRLLANRRKMQSSKLMQNDLADIPSSFSIGCGNTQNGDLNFEAAQHVASTNLLQLNLKASEIAMRYQNSFKDGLNTVVGKSGSDRSHVHICTLIDKI